MVAKRETDGMKGKTFLFIGVLITGISLTLNIAQQTRKFSLFVLFGIGVIVFGFVKIFILEKQDKEIAKIRASYPTGRQGFTPDARPHPHSDARYHPHQSQSQYHAHRKAAFCARCGNHLSPSDRYCPQCGKKAE